MPTTLSSWLHRTVLGGLLLVAYLFAWTPARTAWVEHLADPVLTVAAGGDARVAARPATHTVALQQKEGRITHTAPAGVKFLLPALFLVLLAPARAPLWAFFGGHVALAFLALGLLAVGASGLPGGGVLARFVETYGVDAYSLAVPVLAFARDRLGSRF